MGRSGEGGDLIDAALRLAFVYKCDPFTILVRPFSVIAEVTRRTNAIVEEMNREDG